MKIGQLAEATATPVETIRFYEREGLLPSPGRTASNYRVYGPPQVERLLFIRHCRKLDMTLDEVRVLLRHRDAPLADCEQVNALLDEHIGHVAQRVRELQALARDLRALRSRCVGEHRAADCGILQGIDQAGAPGGPSSRVRHVRGTH